MLSSFIMLSFVVVFAIGIGLCFSARMYLYCLYVQVVESDVPHMCIIVDIMNREIRIPMNQV